VTDIVTIIFFVPEPVGKSAVPRVPVGGTGNATREKIVWECLKYGLGISAEDCVRLHHELAKIVDTTSGRLRYRIIVGSLENPTVVFIIVIRLILFSGLAW
jgi:hypothetical protein